MTIQLEYLGNYGFSITIGSEVESQNASNQKTVFIDPPLQDGLGSPKGRDFPASCDRLKPNYILLTHRQNVDFKGLMQAFSNTTWVAHQALTPLLQGTTPIAPIITMDIGNEIEFPWSRDSGTGHGGSVIMTASEPAQTNGFIIQAEGHQIYHAGPGGLTPETRTIGLTYKPDVAILPIGGVGLAPEQIVQAVMWLGSDIVFPIDVSGDTSEGKQEPVDMNEVYSTIDIYTPAICRRLAEGETYTLQPTQSSGRISGPEARY